MSAVKRLLLVLCVMAGLLGMHALSGPSHAHASGTQVMHDDGAAHHAEASPSQAAGPCDGPAPCPAMAGAGTLCIPLPGGQVPALPAPQASWPAAIPAQAVLRSPVAGRSPDGPSLVKLCISRT